MSFLADSWEAVRDASSGDTYYWNRATGATRWELPPHTTSALPSAALGGGLAGGLSLCQTSTLPPAAAAPHPSVAASASADAGAARAAAAAAAAAQDLDGIGPSCPAGPCGPSRSVAELNALRAPTG